QLIIVLLMCWLSGCARLEYGNFTHAPMGAYELMAKDAAAQIGHVYPPAKNRFHLSQTIRDPFGMKLIELLRQKGFGVIEQSATRSEANFFYVVDEPIPPHLYRVSIFVGSQSLSRAYGIHNAVLVPISPWSRKE
ncbi:conjugal transfer protein TrbH, partial [Legionella sp.]|uniref:conjugal transfer protein TrbH n=1 Tax=Legionella sp. TaxID=459 RepID=UPI003D10FC0C